MIEKRAARITPHKSRCFPLAARFLVGNGSLATFCTKATCVQPEAILTNTRAQRGEISFLGLSRLHDVEEDIWSPTYGLKGKLDASVQGTITTNNPASRTPTIPSLLGGPPPSSRPLPLELKTGRAVAGMEHRAQTMLYTLLMSERYNAPVEEGLLYYTQSEEVIKVPAAPKEIKALVQVRNNIAEAMVRRFRKKTRQDREGDDVEGESRPEIYVQEVEEHFLPETIDDERICGRCFALDACMLYRRVRQFSHSFYFLL